MEGLIQPAVFDRVESRHDARLPTAWVGEARVAPGWTDGHWLTRMRGSKGPLVKDLVLVLLGDRCEDVCAEALDHAMTGARVYALVGPGWGKGPGEPPLLQAPRVLVRRLSEAPASAIHCGTGARLWIGGGFVLRLDPNQAQALRQTFLRLFWHEATEEAWSGGRHLAWRVASERPFDVPELPVSAWVRCDLPNARLFADSRNATLHIYSGPPPETALSRLWFPVGPEHHARLARLAEAGTEILWADRGLPDICVTQVAGEMLLPGARRRLRLRLTAEQRDEVARLLDAPPAWRFQTQVCLGEAKHRAAQFWLPEAATARGLETEQLVPVADVHTANLSGFPASKPTSFPAAHPLALTVRYQWTVLPPRVPKGAEEDALVGRWRKLDEDWTQRMATLRKTLDAAGENRDRIRRSFSRLASSMLGFERTHDALLDQVKPLEDRRPSSEGPQGAHALLAQLGRIEEDSGKLKTEQEDAERKAREDEERDNQKNAWQSRVNEAKRDLPDRCTQLAEAESRRDDIARELGVLNGFLTSSDSKGKQDMIAKRRKLSDDQQRAIKEVTRLEDEVKHMATQAAQPFEFRPPRSPTVQPGQPGPRFVPAVPPHHRATPIPEEALPEVGILRTHKGKRYLVIQEWAQLDFGERAASRLGATLVAAEEA